MRAFVCVMMLRCLISFSAAVYRSPLAWLLICGLNQIEVEDGWVGVVDCEGGWANRSTISREYVCAKEIS